MLEKDPAATSTGPKTKKVDNQYFRERNKVAHPSFGWGARYVKWLDPKRERNEVTHPFMGEGNK